jgi:flagellar biosynthesis/type III secretory pathway protein FliH
MKETHEFISPYFRRLQAEAIAKGKAEGKAEGEAEGEAKGRAEDVFSCFAPAASRWMTRQKPASARVATRSSSRAGSCARSPQ